MPARTANGITSRPDGDTNTNSLEADIALLYHLLAQDVDESGPDVLEMLQRLEAAEGIADGVENRLDGIMDHLDDLLTDLEARTSSEGGGVVSVTQAETVEEVVIVSNSSNSAAVKDVQERK